MLNEYSDSIERLSFKNPIADDDSKVSILHYG